MHLYEELMAQDVKRWHTVPTTRQQTVAEHSFCVAMIARRIMMEARPDNPEAQGDATDTALRHDLHEVWDGDMPANGDKIIAIPPPGAVLVQFVVKMADVIEAHAFIHWYGSGPRAKKIDASYGLLIRNTMEALRNQDDVTLAGVIYSIWREVMEGRPHV